MRKKGVDLGFGHLGRMAEVVVKVNRLTRITQVCSVRRLH